ncbi:MAG: hypothetical protein HFI39_11875 [Lachnospiraceae bacterium]|nr:hypothetical protein [Lachnospiraceae bacterium]
MSGKRRYFWGDEFHSGFMTASGEFAYFKVFKDRTVHIHPGIPGQILDSSVFD